MVPTVSFVVPCYKLGHLLSECVASILSQTYESLEVLIMDDCSPDQTPEVAESFHDPRVKYVRNESNLGHLRNYNKGIGLARGKYVWLISADDRVRRPYALERYVGVMERRPEVGYAFCPAVRLEDGRETDVLDYSIQGTRDTIFDGRRFLARLVKSNCVVAASGMARKECYDRLGAFPLDAPWGGDWYLWCVFALHYDVAYFAEPMVNYRRHEYAMTDSLMQEGARACAEEDSVLSWRLKQKTEEAGGGWLVRKWQQGIADHYANCIVSKKYRFSKGWREYSMTWEEFEGSLRQNAKNRQEEERIRARVYARVADRYYWQQDFARAREFYRRGLREEMWMPNILVKYLLLCLGSPGILVRDSLPRLRHMIVGTKSN